MIENIRGLLVSKLPSRVILEVGGMGLEIQVPFSTFGRLGNPGAETRLLCHLQWREDGPQLFGFATEEERSLFRLLTKIDKIGPKLAINIMSAAPVERLAQMILTENVRELTSMKGVGPKLASRLIVEIKDSIATLGLGVPEPAPDPMRGGIPFEKEIRDALENLGYSNREIDRVLREGLRNATPQSTLQDILEEALRFFAS